MRIWILLAAVCATLGAGAAHACSCVGGSFDEMFRRADLVFEGVVESIEIQPGGQDEADDGLTIVGRAALFRIEREIKGLGKATRVVRYNIGSGGNCGLTFEAGKRYFVSAYEYEGDYSTDSCAMTFETILEPDERNYYAISKAEEYAVANPGDVEAQFRPERIRSELFLEDSVRSYLRSVEIVDDAVMQRIEYAYDAAIAARDFERAEALSERALMRASQFDGDEAGAEMMLAKALREGGRYEEALAAAERALIIDPDLLDAKYESERLRFVVRGEITPGRRDYRRIYARSVDSRKCVAPKADFSGSVFGEADFTDANLNGARFRRVVAENIIFSSAHLRSARFDRVGDGGEFARDARVHDFNADFTGADLRDASFGAAGLSAANFTEADLRAANFDHATISKARFEHAQLDGAQFDNTQFYSTTMDGAQLGAADFSRAKAVNVSWRGVDMRRIAFEGANFKGGIIDCDTKLPRGFVLVGSGLIPEQPKCGRKVQSRNFSGIEWPYFLRLEGFDLNDADFSGGEFRDAEFMNAGLSGADFSNTKGNADFSGADLSGASFQNAKLRVQLTAMTDYRGREFRDAILNGTDFSGAKIDASAFLAGVDETPQFSIDVSEAVFDRTEISCDARWKRREIEEFEKTEGEAPHWISDASEEQRADWRAAGRRRAEEAAAYLVAEGDFIRYLAERWPTAIFDEECQGYLTDAAPREN